MPVSQFSMYMESIVLQLWKFLEPLGFKKNAHTFNRWTQDGLCQVFGLQMGRYEFGVSNPLVPDLYGKFTANLGIFVPELYEEIQGKESPRFIHDYDCAIRARFSNLLNSKNDLWWDLTSILEPTVQTLVDLLRSDGLPFLQRFSDRKSIIEGLVPFAEKHPILTRRKLDIALILDKMGKRERASEMFQQHYRETQNRGHRGHLTYLESLAIRHNWDVIR